MRHQTQCECNSLEPDDVKVSSPVLRGLGDSNAPRLPGIELGTRHVHLAGCTEHPNAVWVTQQARQFCWQLEDSAVLMRFLIHDNDTIFSAIFDAVFQAQGIEVIHTPYRAPNANAVAERWIRSEEHTSELQSLS